MQHKTFSFLTALFLCLIASPQILLAKDLAEIQQQIKQQEQKIAEQKMMQQQLQANLKTQENQINDVLGLLRETEAELSSSKKRIAATNQQIKQLEKQEQKQKDKLAKQLNAAYQAELNSSTIKRLLTDQNQQTARSKQYYEHINQARLKLITELQQTQATLAQERSQLEAQLNNQKTQLAQHKQQRQSLQKVQQERQSTLLALNRTLSQQEAKLDRLRANENALRQEIQRAEQKAREQERKEREAYAQKKQVQEKQTQKPYKPTEQEKQLMAIGKGLGKPNKQYTAPVKGKIIHAFGTVQMGEITWKGTVFAAAAGTPVHAIADGRVILARWFSGYGLMVMVKHGDSDLSLYGYNQALTVKEGQLVKAGEKIAEAGNTGGQPQSSLYFAIRRKGVAVNPMGWVK